LIKSFELNIVFIYRFAKLLITVSRSIAQAEARTLHSVATFRGSSAFLVWTEFYPATFLILFTA